MSRQDKIIALVFWTLAALGALALAARAEEGYEFPKGVPYEASKVEWYNTTPWFQYFDGAGPNGWNTIEGFSQTWQAEFPWRTGGLDQSDNAKTFKFHVKAKTGEIESWRERGRYFSNAHPAGYYRFKIPKGEIFGEVIETDGRTTEIGTLEGTGGEPKFHVYRSFGTREELKPWIVKEGWGVQRLRNPHPVNVLDETALVVAIELSPEGVRKILAQPFREVTDQVFAEDAKGNKCFAPTTEQRSGIVPRHSQRGFFSTKQCLACHRTAGMEGRLIDPNPNPDKYGAIRGGGFVFSAPFRQWLAEGRIRASGSR
jgi:hypothetical protein